MIFFNIAIYPYRSMLSKRTFKRDFAPDHEIEPAFFVELKG